MAALDRFHCTLTYSEPTDRDYRNRAGFIDDNHP